MAKAKRTHRTRRFEWRLVSEDEQREQERLDKLNMPPEVWKTCPQCGAGPGGWCITRAGNWAPTSHKKRLA